MKNKKYNDIKYLAIFLLISILIHLALFISAYYCDFFKEKKKINHNFTVSYSSYKKPKPIIKTKISDNRPSKPAQIINDEAKKSITLNEKQKNVQTVNHPIKNETANTNETETYNKIKSETQKSDSIKDKLPNLAETLENQKTKDIKNNDETDNEKTSELTEEAQANKDSTQEIKAGNNSIIIMPLETKEQTAKEIIDEYEKNNAKISIKDKQRLSILLVKFIISESGSPKNIEYAIESNDQEINETIKQIVSLTAFNKNQGEQGYLPILVFSERKSNVIKIQRKGDFKGKTIEIPHMD